MALNQTGIHTTKATTPNSILVAPETAVAFPVFFSEMYMPDFGLGQLYTELKAGTPVFVDTVGHSCMISATPKNGVILHDVTGIVDNKATVTVLIKGVVDLNKLDSEVQALLTPEVKEEFKHILFIK